MRDETYGKKFRRIRKLKRLSLVKASTGVISKSSLARWELGYDNLSWSPMKLALISANNFVFDYVTIILPRMERNSIESFIIVRKPKLQALIRGLAPKEYSYLLLFVIVHLTAFDISNLISSLLILLVMIIVWLVLVFVMTYRLSVVKQNVLVFLLLLGLRTLIFSLNL